MAHQIQVRYTVEDGRSLSNLKTLRTHSVVGKKLRALEIIDVYTIDCVLSKSELSIVAKALHSPLTQTYIIDAPFTDHGFSFAVEIGFLPGVTDNIAHTARETINDVLHNKVGELGGVYSSRLYFLTGQLKISDATAIAQSLYNPLIQRCQIKSSAQFKKDRGMDVILPKVVLVPGKVTTVDLNISDTELEVLGKKGIKNEDGTHRGPLGMGLTELKAVRTYFTKQDRLPTDIELETIAQTWSEHCKHTIFANPLDEIKDGIYKHYIKRATQEIRKTKGKNDFCVSVFSDNSGIIKFDEKTYITHKVETHNSPSALDPFGGAITGIVGVNRDTLGTGLGAKPLLNIYGYCFADPSDTTRLFRDKEKTQELLSAKRIMEGVIEGVNAGGNQSGIATPQGFVHFDKRYRGKPLVFVGTVGVLPSKIKGKSSYEKAAKVGDYIVMVGGRVGLDGIHGATFSSEALDAGSPATAVQIGDAITQKKFSDAIIKEVRDLGLYSSITDNGAGGLSSSVGEMARESGGCEVWLDKVPQKYAGLSPWQVWISESQERMTLAVPKKNWSALQKIMKKHGSEVTVIGKFTKTGRCIVTHKKKTILDLEMNFLHLGNPKHEQKSQKVVNKETAPASTTLKKYEKTIDKTLIDLLRRANVASTEFISSQYDHEVQGVSVTKPLQGRGRVNATATVSRPHTDTKKGIVLSQGLCPSYSDIDTYHMAASAIDQAVRNAVAAGGDPEYIALLDNFCWSSSHEPKRLYELKRAAKACYDYAVAYQAPFISGKDSMFNDFKGFDMKQNALNISAPPTLLVSSIATIPDISNATTLDLKKTRDALYLVGDTKSELGGSEFISYVNQVEQTDFTGLGVPRVDARVNFARYKRFHQAVLKGLVTSALALDKGGLGIAVLKSAIAGQLGASIDLDSMGSKTKTNIERLFSESNGRILVSVSPDKQSKFESTMKGTAVRKIGQVTSAQKIAFTYKKKLVSSISVKDATTEYRSKFKNF